MKFLVEDSMIEDSFKIPTCAAYALKNSPADGNDFFAGEHLGTVVEPRCSGCRCGKCPVPGSRYSYREETEL